MMTLEQWRAVIAARDALMIACALGAASFALNWYVFPRARNVMVWLAIAAVIVSITVRLYWR